jgi:hypothetical protein
MVATGVADTGWYRDRIGNVDVAYVHGSMTEASFEHFLAQACRSIDECGDDERLAMFVEAQEPALMDSRWRKRMANALKVRAAKLARTRPAYAMVTPSLMVRSALKVVHWTAPPPYPHAIVATLEEGFEFIARHMPGVDPQALQADYEYRRATYLATRGRG